MSKALTMGELWSSAGDWLTNVLRSAHRATGPGIAEFVRIDGDETAKRMVKAMDELLSGYTDDPASHVKVFPAGPDPGIVVVRGMPFASVCEHHVLPFTGVADVAYLPGHAIIGLSKVPRMLRAVSRRLQVQERIGQELADALAHSPLAPLGVMVVLRGRHTCMALRGAESPGEMVTSCVRGVFATKPEARAEAMELFRAP